MNSNSSKNQVTRMKLRFCVRRAHAIYVIIQQRFSINRMQMLRI